MQNNFIKWQEQQKLTNKQTKTTTKISNARQLQRLVFSSLDYYILKVDLVYFEQSKTNKQKKNLPKLSLLQKVSQTRIILKKRLKK